MKPAKVRLTGTPAQIEWAERIRPLVDTEFDRVANALKGAASPDTDAVIAILEEKRHEVMARDQAGYFIHDWQELNDQVRQMIGQDARFQAIQARRAAQRS
jgi:hypothetical protein